VPRTDLKLIILLGLLRLVKIEIRCCTKDEGMAPRNLLTEVGSKPPYATLVKSHGSER